MPVSERVRAAALLALALLALAGCRDPEPSAGLSERGAGLSEPPVPSAGLSEPPPAAVSENPALGLSYEVAIATAAAHRNRALRECETRPEAERQACIEVALANWEVERAATADLRGEQP